MNSMYQLYKSCSAFAINTVYDGYSDRKRDLYSCDRCNLFEKGCVHKRVAV